MKILLTGANGYIGARLLPALLDEGHEVIAFVRRRKNFELTPQQAKKFIVIQGDLLDKNSLKQIPENLDAAYYLVHSMSTSKADFHILESTSARNLIEELKLKQAKQIIYLSGISHGKHLSAHLASRLEVEKIIEGSDIPYTVLRAGIIIGSGSASFEMIRDLCEKLPVMVTPKWVNNRTQPLAISDVLFYLKSVLGLPNAYNQIFEIGGPDQLTYKEMLLHYAEIRGLKRFIINVPVLTPRLSSYWLYFVTSTNFSLASALVESLKNDTTCKDFKINQVVPHSCLTYDEAVKRALSKIEQNHIISSWRDALVLSNLNPDLQKYIHIPTNGCFVDKQKILTRRSPKELLDNIWSIGGTRGWYYGKWAWKLRGFVDKLFGGIGLNRGRTHTDTIETGDVVDFWRVLLADKKTGRLLLYAEMKLPGEAWLEFKVTPEKRESIFEQTATFRPKGLLGRLYWYLLFPFHIFIFRGMANKLVRYEGRNI
jgi:uncharacterized protein YbjT (DUF2867 family)